MRSLIDMAADRGAFIDQSQSLNLFMENPSIGACSSMYFYAWKKGLKTTYYLRSRPATRIAQANSGGRSKQEAGNPLGEGNAEGALGSGVASSDEANARRSAEAIACSLENPESCEACQ